MLPIGPILALMAALSAVTAVYQHQQTNRAISDSAKLTHENFRRQLDNASKVFQQINTEEQQRVSDRMRKARRDIGTLNVAASEMGASAASMQGLVAEQGFSYGLDLSRIRQGASSEREAVQGGLEGARFGAAQDLSSLRNQARAANLRLAGGLVGAAGDGAEAAIRWDE